jgi:hypothetical protein
MNFTRFPNSSKFPSSPKFSTSELRYCTSKKPIIKPLVLPVVVMTLSICSVYSGNPRVRLASALGIGAIFIVNGGFVKFAP